MRRGNLIELRPEYLEVVTEAYKESNAAGTSDTAGQKFSNPLADADLDVD